MVLTAILNVTVSALTFGVFIGLLEAFFGKRK